MEGLGLPDAKERGAQPPGDDGRCHSPGLRDVAVGVPARNPPVPRKTRLTSERVEARVSKRHGLGVFARCDIGKGEVVEHCPVLLLDPRDAQTLAEGSLSGYMYDWDDGRSAIALGCGSLYNHDPDPSAEYRQGADGASLIVKARRHIATGDEITIDYTGGGAIELWFDLD